VWAARFSSFSYSPHLPICGQMTALDAAQAYYLRTDAGPRALLKGLSSALPEQQATRSPAARRHAALKSQPDVGRSAARFRQSGGRRISGKGPCTPARDILKQAPQVDINSSNLRRAPELRRPPGILSGLGFGLSTHRGEHFTSLPRSQPDSADRSVLSTPPGLCPIESCGPQRLAPLVRTKQNRVCLCCCALPLRRSG